MTKTASSSESDRSIKTLFMFCMVVLALIIGALLIRFSIMVQQSIFSRNQQFNLLIEKNSAMHFIYSFNGPSHSLSILTISGKPKKNVELQLGVPIDGKLSFPSADEKKDMENITSLLFHYSGMNTKLTYYDIMQMAFYVYTMPKDQLQHESVTFPVSYSDDFEQTMTELFADPQIKNDDQSIQIINATGVSGIGSQLEWVLSHVSSHIVAVSTAQKNNPHTTISYTGEKTYTVSRLERLLQVTARKISEKGISDIIIIIGEDRKNISFLH